MVRRPFDKVFSKVVDRFSNSFDAFDTLLSNQPRNQIDIASQYRFSPERLRLLKNGSRQFVQYNETANFSDNPASYTMLPNGGDDMIIESAESSTYVVGSGMSSSFAFQINQSLQNTDTVRAGPYNDNDGWFMEHRGDHPNDRTVDFKVLRGGVETTLRSDVELSRPVTGWYRYNINYNWYNVGNQQWIQTFTNDGKQINKTITKTSIDTDKSTDTANLPIRYEVDADANTTGLELDVGSISFKVRSSGDQLIREKPQHVEVDIPATNNVWHPVYAIRLNPGTNVNSLLKSVQILDYSNDAEVSIQVVSVDSSKTDASSFVTPSYHHEANSELHDTQNVSTVSDRDGVETDPDTTDFEPGGITLAAADIHPSGKSFKSGAVSSGQKSILRQILGTDIVVFLVKSSGAGGTLHFDYVTEQFW